MISLRQVSLRQVKGKREMLKGKVAPLIKAFFLILSLFPFTFNLALASSPGTTTGDLLKVPLGTRAIGMGEAYSALADDSSALYWNPAGMAFVTQKEASFMHTSLLESVHLEQLSFVAPGDSYAFGTNVSYLGYGDIAGYDNAGVPTSNVNAYSYFLNGGIARRITDSLSLGLSAGLLHETLDQDAANTFAVNAGSLYELSAHPFGAHYNLGLSVQNLGPGLKFVSERDPLPRKINFGIAALGLKEKPINLTADVTVPNDNSPYVSLGSEYWFHEIVALRLGYSGANNEGKGLRVGLGLKYADFLFDYAYGGFGDFGATQRVSLSMRFGEKIKQLNNEERAILKEAKASERKGAYVPAIIAYNELLDKDPANDHILHMMINAHDKLVKVQVHEEVAQKTVPIPSPEEAAIAEGIPEPGASALAQTLPSMETINPNDPLNLNKLPDLNTLDVAVGSPLKSNLTPGLATTAVSPVSVADTIQNPADLAPAAQTAPAANDTPALSPADIYGN